MESHGNAIALIRIIKRSGFISEWNQNIQIRTGPSPLNAKNAKLKKRVIC